jgi:hypothetical protein
VISADATMITSKEHASSTMRSITYNYADSIDRPTSYVYCPFVDGLPRVATTLVIEIGSGFSTQDATAIFDSTVDCDVNATHTWYNFTVSTLADRLGLNDFDCLTGIHGTP